MVDNTLLNSMMTGVRTYLIEMRGCVRNLVDMSRRVGHCMNVIAMSLVINVRRRMRDVVDVCRGMRNNVLLNRSSTKNLCFGIGNDEQRGNTY